MTDWMTIRVVLVGREGAPSPMPAGRVLLAHADHTLADLAEAMDTAFGRWDLTPLHEFRIAGRHLLSDLDSAEESDVAVEQSDEVALRDVGLRPGSTLRYVFDLGERWVHECDVESMGVDPVDLYGEQPDIPVPVFGWGPIPDQYGRDSEEEDEDMELPSRLFREEEDDDAFLAAWEEARAVAWQVIETAVAEVDRRLDAEELHRVATAMRTHAGSRRYPYDVLWAAAGLTELPEDDRTLWITLAAAAVEPDAELPVDLEVEAAWATLEPADWAGAVIELTRAGIGQPADPPELVALIARCPEIEGPELTKDEVATLEVAFTPIVDLWRVLGVVDDHH
ncbi:MAG: hypothetical protein GEU81_10610, partial [Nitriliruptorales bacterium]|nr:hypothetical protein [Nitriliruptorales bacterium]